MKPLWTLLLVCLSTSHVRGQSSEASSLDQLPTCASDCLASAVSNSPCSATNETCICSNESIEREVTLCVTQNCTIKEALTAKNVTTTQCNAPIRNKSAEYEAISDTFGILSGVFVLSRFAFKIYARLELGLDDWFTLVTIIVGVPSTVLAVYGTIANGLGQDVWTLSFAEITDFSKYFYVMSIIYFAEVALLKLAFLFFYLRIFPSTPIRRILWATVIVNCIFGIVFVAAAIFQCRPVDAAFLRWDGEYEAQCINLNALGWSNAAISIILDIWMLAIPLSQLNGLRLNWKKKIGVGLMMSVGAFVTVVSILRLQSLVKYGSHSLNPTWEYFEVSKWSTIEINVGIICSCMPTMRLILVRMFPKQLGTTKEYTDYGNNQPGQGRGRSRTFGATATADKSHNRTESRGITLQRTYAVEYGDSDEAQLVHMAQLDNKSTKSDSYV